MSSSIEKKVAEFRAALLRREARAAAEILRAYEAAWRRIEIEIAKLVGTTAAEKTVAASLLAERRRLEQLLDQLSKEIADVASIAAEVTTAEQSAAVRAAQEHAAALTGSKATRGRAVEIVGGFARLPKDEIANLVGAAGDGSPLKTVFNDLAASLSLETGERVKHALIEGMTLGWNERQTIAHIRRAADAKGANLQREPAIVRRLHSVVRTETFRAYRTATSEAYKASGVVRAWRWVAATSPSTCVLCWAQHGKIFPLDAPMVTHPNCRCVKVPVLRADEKFETGAEKFAKLEQGYQKQIIGERAHEAYARGDVRLSDLVGVRDNERWGQSLYRRSLDDALGARDVNRGMGAREMLGLRRPSSENITAEGRAFVEAEFAAIGGDVRTLRFNEGRYTGYEDLSDTVFVRGNIFPREEDAHPRSRMSVRAALAHELAHRHYRHTDFEPNGWLDELRASYWAAINVPNLSKEDRADLINDAIMQGRQANRAIRPNAIMRSILRGEYEHDDR